MPPRSTTTKGGLGKTGGKRDPRHGTAVKPRDGNRGASGTSPGIEHERPWERKMNQLRLDPLTGRWVVVSVDRARRPSAFVFSPRVSVVQADTSVPCPF